MKQDQYWLPKPHLLRAGQSPVRRDDDRPQELPAWREYRPYWLQVYGCLPPETGILQETFLRASSVWLAEYANLPERFRYSLGRCWMAHVRRHPSSVRNTSHKQLRDPHGNRARSYEGRADVWRDLLNDRDRWSGWRRQVQAPPLLQSLARIQGPQILKHQ